MNTQSTALVVSLVAVAFAISCATPTAFVETSEKKPLTESYNEPQHIQSEIDSTSRLTIASGSVEAIIPPTTLTTLKTESSSPSVTKTPITVPATKPVTIVTSKIIEPVTSSSPLCPEPETAPVTTPIDTFSSALSETSSPNITIAPAVTMVIPSVSTTTISATTTYTPELTSAPQTQLPQTTPVTENDKLNFNGQYSFLDESVYSEYELSIVRRINDAIDLWHGNPNMANQRFQIEHPLDYSSYYKIASYFYLRYGQKCALHNTFDVVTVNIGNGIKNYFIEVRLDSLSEIEETYESILIKVDSILTTFCAGTEEEILYQIAQYLESNVVYAHGYGELSHALFEGKAICNGYALAFNILANRAGIKTDICVGKIESGYHTWNRVTLNDGSYRFYDITWYDTGGKDTVYLHSETPFGRSFFVNDYSECWLA